MITDSERPPAIPKTTPWPSYALFVFALLLLPVLVASGPMGTIPAIVLMIVLHHAGHEAVHGALSPWRSASTNAISGWLAFAMLGQNFIFMRWSHLAHHRYGRLKPEYTIDRSDAALSRRHYFLCLFGASNIYHELAGYLYPVVGTRFQMLSRRFESRYYHSAAYVIGQTLVFAVNVALWWLGGWTWLACKVAFTLYWGATQNVAHYGLAVGAYPGSRIASRTYRLPHLVEFLLFRSGPYHLEHHLLPHVPGPRLRQAGATVAVREKLGRDVIVRGGLLAYLLDVVAQYCGPHPTSDFEDEWSAPIRTEEAVASSGTDLH